MTDRELMQQALDAFVWNYNTDLDNIPECEQWLKLLKTNIAALRERLAQPERPWVGLTDEDKESFWTADEMTGEEWDELFNEVENKLRSKNT